MQECFDLTAIGATPTLVSAFRPYELRGLLLGRVSVVHGDRYRIYTARAGRWPPKPSGRCSTAQSVPHGPRWATGWRRRRSGPGKP